MNPHEVFIHIHQGCFAGTGAIVRLPQCQWSKPDGYGKISQCITTTKHSKAKTVCIFLGIYYIWGVDNHGVHENGITECHNLWSPWWWHIGWDVWFPSNSMKPVILNRIRCKLWMKWHAAGLNFNKINKQFNNINCNFRTAFHVLNNCNNHMFITIKTVHIYSYKNLKDIPVKDACTLYI